MSMYTCCECGEWRDSDYDLCEECETHENGLMCPACAEDKPESGEVLRDRGMKKAADNAEMKVPGWAAMALESVRKYPYKTFRAEEVRVWAYSEGLPRPPHGRAWGGVMATANRLGIVQRGGFQNVSNPKAHRTPATLWEKVR